MRTFLMRVAAMLLAGGAVLTTSVSATADPARTFTISGTVLLSSGAPADRVSIAACATDCLHREAPIADVAEPDPQTGAYTLSVPAGTYVLVVFDIANEPGYDLASGADADDGYLAPRLGGTGDTVVDAFAAAEPITVKAPGAERDIELGAAIHSPARTFVQTTPGNLTDRPCERYTTTVTPAPFSDVPADATIRYQWYVGTQVSSPPIPGATGLSYTATPEQVGEHLSFEMVAQAPGRIGWDKVVDLGMVGGDECIPMRHRVPVTSYGVRVGRAVHGRRVAVVGASAPGARISYRWMLDGAVVHRGSSYILPMTSHGKRLTVALSFSAPGYLPRRAVRAFGRVR